MDKVRSGDILGSTLDNDASDCLVIDFVDQDHGAILDSAYGPDCNPPNLIVSFPFTSDDSPTNLDTSILSGATVSYGPGLSDHYVDDDGFGYVIELYPLSSNATASLELDAYMSITLSIDGTLDLAQLSYSIGKGGDPDPRGYRIRTSFDNFATDLVFEDLPTGSQVAPVSHTIYFNSDFSELTETFEIRFYVWTPDGYNDYSVDIVDLNLYDINLGAKK
jgi:hypothetical protein